MFIYIPIYILAFFKELLRLRYNATLHKIYCVSTILKDFFHFQKLNLETLQCLQWYSAKTKQFDFNKNSLGKCLGRNK